MVLAGLFALPLMAADDEHSAEAAGGPDTVSLPAPPPGQAQVFVRSAGYDDSQSESRQTVWLGVGVEETSKPLAAQLGLKPGEGLVIDYVSTNSPAATAGLRENDVLVELDGQMLVDAVQLRKLVQMHQDGDTVKIAYYRAGKKETVAAKLAKQTLQQALWNGKALPQLTKSELFRLDGDQKSAGMNKQFQYEQVQQAMQLAQKAVRDAMQVSQATVQNAMKLSQLQDGGTGLNTRLEIIQKKLGNLANGGTSLDKDATVVVKNQGAKVQTIVKKDDTGTYIIFADPTRHLTAHDANGKLLFDGTIESPEQQKKVPKEIWKKVEPMLDQLNVGSEPGADSSSKDDLQEN